MSTGTANGLAGFGFGSLCDLFIPGIGRASPNWIHIGVELEPFLRRNLTVEIRFPLNSFFFLKRRSEGGSLKRLQAGT